MRLIGHLENETLARRLGQFLGHQNIAHQWEPEDGMGWALWILSEEDLERARRIYLSFRGRPEDPTFSVPATKGVPGTSGSAEGVLPGRPASTAARSTAGRGGAIPVAGDHGHLTIGVMIACFVVAFITGLGGDHPLVEQMMISQRFWRWGVTWKLFLPEVRAGEVWRLISPAFLHFGWPHLLSNMWSFWSLGRAIEYVRGTPKLMGLMVGLALVSNLGQYLVGGPFFGGMSGVIYGLLGYVWMLGRHRPEAGLALPPQMVVMMLVWLVICASGALGVRIANTAHLVGLVAGMLWAKWEARRG